MKTEYRLDELFDLQMGKTPARNNPEYWDKKAQIFYYLERYSEALVCYDN